MRIAINAELLSFSETYRSGGISRVIYHLLAELGRDPRGQHYDVFVPASPPPGDPLGAGHDWLRFISTGQRTLRPSFRIAWEQLALPQKLAALKPDLLHGLAYALPAGW